MRVGRPTLYKEEYCEKIIELAKSGLFLEEIAEEFEVDFWTMWNWSKTNQEFSQSYARARNIIIARLKKEMLEKNGEKFFQSKVNEFLIEQMTRQAKQACVQVDNFASDKIEKSVEALLKAVEQEKIRADEFVQLMNGLMTAQNIVRADEAINMLEKIEDKK